MMPITGTTVTVLGQNFMDIVSITMGNRSVDLSTVTVSEANDMLTLPCRVHARHLLTRHYHNGRYCRSSGLLSFGEYSIEL